jgi:DNA adenine methylase
MAVVVNSLFPSPLRYPGGKGQLSNFVKLLMLRNGLVGAEYLEPYAGGASVALSLLYEDYASHVHINDVDRSVYTFWKVAVGDTSALCERVLAADVTVEEWHRQREVQTEDHPADLDLAYSTFFLNRTSRSGIISGGVIGGLGQTGKWKIDARFNRKDLARRLRRIGRFRGRITVTNSDAAELLAGGLADVELPFVYLDPPYYAKGGDLYANHYQHDDHDRVASIVRELRVPWMVSYDAHAEIEHLYSEWTSMRYSLSYSAQERYSGTELMFFSDGLRIPEVESPAKVRSRDVDVVRMAA